MQYEKLIHQFGRSGSNNKAKRTKRVRKPGDDEFGLQPRLTRPKPNKKRRRAAKTRRRGAGRKSGPRTKAKKDVTPELIKTNTAFFLRECDKKPWEPVPHGAKTRATLDLVSKW